jgi:hypothetical protein
MSAKRRKYGMPVYKNETVSQLFAAEFCSDSDKPQGRSFLPLWVIFRPAAETIKKSILGLLRWLKLIEVGRHWDDVVEIS